MTRLVSLQMISLLIFNDHMSVPAAGRHPRCVGVEQVNRSAGQFHRSHGSRLRFAQNLSGARTCAEAAAEMHGDLSNRSLSPWTYRLNRDDDRIPHEILFAECLCGGCIINQREDLRYNSVPVLVLLEVMRTTPCPRDPKKFVMHKGVIKIPVGCTCAEPNYAK